MGGLEVVTKIIIEKSTLPLQVLYTSRFVHKGLDSL